MTSVTGPAKKISAASARAHTRRNKSQNNTFSIFPAMFVPVAAALAVGLLGWVYQSLKPPQPKLCGSLGGPAITSPRVKLSDGRHLAYREMGVPKVEANYKIIFVHGFNSSKDVNLPISQELINELRIYFLFFDRAGYGDSDPYPSRSVKSEAYDIQELADKLEIGPKFYVIGVSMGAYPVYGCLKYIPHRLCGASLVVPFVHYWWPCLPANIAQAGFQKLLPSDQRSFQIAHHTPWLFYWWMTQKWFPSLSIMAGNMAIFGPSDMEVIAELANAPSVGQEKALQQGVHESLYRDIIAGYAKWEFDPLDLKNPSPDNKSIVHICPPNRPFRRYAQRINKSSGELMRNISNTFNHHGALTTLLRSTSTGLDYALYGHLLQYFSDHSLPFQAKQLHARLILFSVTPGNFLASKLISAYGKCSIISFARHVFDQIPHKNTFSYNAMLIAYSLNDHHTDTCTLFSSLAWSNSVDLWPDNYSVTCLLKSLPDFVADGRKLVKAVHGFVMSNGLGADVVVENALVSCYARLEDLGSARSVFDAMRERDVVSWNSMISGYSQCGFYDECKGLYREMVHSPGIKPNGVTLVSVLQACGQSKDLVFGMEVHRFAVDHSIEMDISVCNALIALYAKCGSLDYARELFKEMSEKDEVTFGALISGYMLHGFVEEGLAIFKEIKSPVLSTWNAVISGLVQNNHYEGVLDLVRAMQASGLKPNTVTISSILPALSCFPNLKGAKEIHAFAIKKGFEKNIYVATSIIDAYSKSGYLNGARKVFDHSKGMSLIIWTAIISAYAGHGDANSSLSLFNEMLDNGIQPDSVTFTAVLTACAHCGMVHKAWEIFDSMFIKHGIHPSVEHYACVVSVLTRAGKLSEATEFVSRMPIEPSAKVWGALLNGAAVSGDVELGKFVCERLFEIEPENTGNYVIMANLYSQAGRWKEADSVRERMNRMGMKKTPGSSWTETSKGPNSFVANGTSSNNPERIYETLKGLRGSITEELTGTPSAENEVQHQTSQGTVCTG